MISDLSRIFIIFLFFSISLSQPAIQASKFDLLNVTKEKIDEEIIDEEYIIGKVFVSFIDQEGGDIRFKLKDEEMAAYPKPLYLQRCPEFKKSINNDSIVEIDSRIIKESLIEFLSYLLIKKAHISSENKWELFLLSQEYKIRSLEEIIEHEIIKNISSNNAMEIYLEANTHNQHTLGAQIMKELILTDLASVFSLNVQKLNCSHTQLLKIIGYMENSCEEGWLYKFFYKWSKELEDKNLIPKDTFISSLRQSFCPQNMSLEQLTEHVIPINLITLDSLLIPSLQNKNASLSILSKLITMNSSFNCDQSWLFLYMFQWTNKLITRRFLQKDDFKKLIKLFCLQNMPYEGLISKVFVTRTISDSRIIELLNDKLILNSQTINCLLDSKTMQDKEGCVPKKPKKVVEEIIDDNSYSFLGFMIVCELCLYYEIGKIILWCRGE